MELLRIWTEVDITEIQNRLLIVDDKFGFCPSCKRVGINLENLKNCPECNRDFRYVTSREAIGDKGSASVLRIRRKLPHLTFVDYSDFERVTSKKKAEGLFSGI